MIKKLLLASAATALLTGAASAADLPRRAAPPPVFTPVPVFTWTGAYFGINAGYAFDASDRCIGTMAGPNCRGPEKVRRLKAQFGDDVHLAAAYGDTSGDREMLQIADEKGYRVFRGKPN